MVSGLTIMSPNVEIFIFLKMLHKVVDHGYYLAAVILYNSTPQDHRRPDVRDGAELSPHSRLVPLTRT
ncbi:hypothetical protein Pcinc_018155 [Petrolisthes cinctipes]|uniref:Uncharacterized protein n=1 Tax=Petrolisthes cinctipes TaxID=88211 RepID=A0AAE1KMT1_PETCI|nr:hypothetical protein Pcinc_018155 [Petrolisthes cinctipes]